MPKLHSIYLVEDLVCDQVRDKSADFFLTDRSSRFVMWSWTFFGRKQILSKIEAMEFENDKCTDCTEQLTI